LKLGLSIYNFIKNHNFFASYTLRLCVRQRANPPMAWS